MLMTNPSQTCRTFWCQSIALSVSVFIALSIIPTRQFLATANQSADIIVLAERSQDDANVTLKAALEANRLDHARSALQRGANADLRLTGPEQETVLIVSVKQFNYDAAALLLSHSADPNAASLSGKTPLLHAANQGSLELVSLLLEHGAIVDHQDLEDGASALLLAARYAHRPVVKRLLKAKADPNLADNQRGNTPLIAASARRTGYATTVALIGGGADVNKQAKDGWSALMSAVDQGISDTVQVLLLNGADVSASTDTGMSAVELAIQGGHTEIFSQLLDRSGSPDEVLASGETPLTLAVDGQHHDIVHQLLDTDVDVNTLNARGLSPLTLAVTRGDDYLTSLLLGAGANVNQKSETTGNTALMVAANRDIPALVELLLTAGADASIEAKDGWTALQAAEMVGSDASATLIRKALTDLGKGH